MTPTAACASCRFFRAPIDEPRWGQCRRRAPVMGELGCSTFPPTASVGWCGEHEHWPCATCHHAEGLHYNGRCIIGSCQCGEYAEKVPGGSQEPRTSDTAGPGQLEG